MCNLSTALGDVRFSNRPFGVKHFQTIHPCGVYVARGLVAEWPLVTPHAPSVHHLRRWERLGITNKAVVEWNGKPVRSVRKGFEAAVEAAGLSSAVTPHILRHTCATWLMQRGVNLWDAAGFLGMTAQQLNVGW